METRRYAALDGLGKLWKAVCIGSAICFIAFTWFGHGPIQDVGVVCFFIALTSGFLWSKCDNLKERYTRDAILERKQDKLDAQIAAVREAFANKRDNISKKHAQQQMVNLVAIVKEELSKKGKHISPLILDRTRKYLDKVVKDGDVEACVSLSQVIQVRDDDLNESLKNHLK